MQVALVTGASRGVGRGIAISLNEAGFKVFATGRTVDTAQLPDGVVRVACDHLRAEQTSAVYAQIAKESGRLDLLVNSAWGGYERMVENGAFTWTLPFWEQPDHRWASMMDVGVHSSLTASALAAKMMMPAHKGLIVNISYWAAQKYIGNVIYGMAKAAIDKMSADMALELQPHGIAVVSLYPGLVRTESVMEAANSGFLDLSNSESPEFIGRVIAALARVPNVLERTGKTLVAASLALELGVRDIDGKQPIPLTVENA